MIGRDMANFDPQPVSWWASVSVKDPTGHGCPTENRIIPSGFILKKNKYKGVGGVYRKYKS